MRPLLFGFGAIAAIALAAPRSPDVQPNIEYGRADGQPLLLDAFIPAGKGPFPAVILVHGGGWMSGDKTGGPTRDRTAPMEDPLGRAGYAWFSINYRLAPKYPYPACIEDQETAIRWVKAHAAEYRVDSGRIALLGESAGGHMVAMTAVRDRPELRVAATVVFYGPTDLVADTERRGGLSASMKALFHLTTFDQHARTVMADASPINFIKPGLPPFLLVHGTADKTVAYSQSVLFQARLKANGIPCDLITIPKATHGMLGWSKLAPDYPDRVIAWLNKAMAAPE